MLTDHGLDVYIIGEAVGQASALKMCYAAITKGAVLLGTPPRFWAAATVATKPEARAKAIHAKYAEQNPSK